MFEENEGITTDIECTECGDTYLGWVDQEPGLCLDCFACNEDKGKD